MNIKNFESFVNLYSAEEIDDNIKLKVWGYTREDIEDMLLELSDIIDVSITFNVRGKLKRDLSLYVNNRSFDGDKLICNYCGPLDNDVCNFCNDTLHIDYAPVIVVEFIFNKENMNNIFNKLECNTKYFNKKSRMIDSVLTPEQKFIDITTVLNYRVKNIFNKINYTIDKSDEYMSTAAYGHRTSTNSLVSVYLSKSI